jgi:hypothetical protein
VCPWLPDTLAAVRRSARPDDWIGAGVRRDLVWDERCEPGYDAAIDVAFFDPTDRDRDGAATESLASLLPAVLWEATNQTAVHTWFPAHFGGAPCRRCSASPTRSRPGRRRQRPSRSDSTRPAGWRCAPPTGLTDLLAGIWRHNPRRTTMEQSRQRLARQRPAERWPGVRVV